jgi:tetratricopeptide (TPR) repeat protein
VAILESIFGGSSLDAFLVRGRKRLAAGRFDEALKQVEAGLSRYPSASALVELGHVVRRAQARAGMQALVERVEQGGEPAAHEQLIALYREVGMPAEALSAAERYAREHPTVAAPHVLLGEAALDTFYADLRSRDGRAALDHLLRAGSIDPDALKPRLLLAELYYSIGADKALVGQAKAIARLAGEDEVVKPLLEVVRQTAKPSAQESVDACLARVEVAGACVRDLETWPGGRKRATVSEQDARRIARAVERLVRDGEAEEAVALARSGDVVASADPRSLQGAGESEPALAGVARTVGRPV